MKYLESMFGGETVSKAKFDELKADYTSVHQEYQLALSGSEKLHNKVVMQAHRIREQEDELSNLYKQLEELDPLRRRVAEEAKLMQKIDGLYVVIDKLKTREQHLIDIIAKDKTK